MQETIATLKDIADVFICKDKDFTRMISPMKSIHGQKITGNLRLMRSIMIVFRGTSTRVRPLRIENEASIHRFDNIQTKLLYFSHDLPLYDFLSYSNG